MSSCPGVTLEAYLSWYFRSQIEPALLAIFEEHRQSVEDMLLDFDEEARSWRGYSQYVEEIIPKQTWDKAKQWLESEHTKLSEAYDKLASGQKAVPDEMQKVLLDNLTELRLS